MSNGKARACRHWSAHQRGLSQRATVQLHAAAALRLWRARVGGGWGNGGRACLLLCILGSLLILPAAHPIQAQMNSTRGTIIIGVATDVPPFAAQAENGQVIGFDVELIKLLTRTAGLRVAYEAVPFTQLIPGVATRLYDATIGCIAATDARKSLVDFSTGYLTTGNILVVATDHPPLTTIAELTPENRVSVLAESASWRLLTQASNAEVVAVTTLAEALALAAARSVDAALVEEIAAERYMRLHPEIRLQRTSGLISPSQCAIAVSKDSPQLLLELNAALTRLKNNGKYLALYRRWFGNRPLEGPRATVLPSTASTTTLATAAPADPLVEATLGVYRLTLLTAPATYQLIELGATGEWLAGEVVANAAPLQGITTLAASQQASRRGTWQIAQRDPVAMTVQITATLPLSAPSASALLIDGGVATPLPQTIPTTATGNQEAWQTAPLRQEYQMTIQADGKVTGSTILYHSTMPTSTQLITTTYSFVGQRMIY